MLRSLFFSIGVLHGLNCNPPHATSVNNPDNAAPATESSAAFKLLDAKYENSVSGYNGAKRTEYYINISVLTSDQLQFDSAWINGERHAIFLSKASGTISNTAPEPKKGEQIILRVTAPGSAKKQAVSPPLTFNGDALLRYQIGSKQYYFVVKEIKLQTTPNRQ